MSIYILLLLLNLFSKKRIVVKLTQKIFMGPSNYKIDNFETFNKNVSTIMVV
jgi:hypothetical protein